MTSFLSWPFSHHVPWRALWIAPAGIEKQTNVVFRARCSWMLDRVPSSCLLHLAAETRYRAYVNGVEVGLGPVRGTCNVNFFDSYQIAPLLRTGENWLAVAVQSSNRATFKASPATPSVLAQLDEGHVVASDASWQMQIAPDWRPDVPLFTFQIGYMEWQNLAAEPHGWQVGQDQGSWSDAAVVSQNPELHHKALQPRDIPALREDLYYPTDFPMIASVPLIDPKDLQVGKRMHSEPHQPLQDQLNLTDQFRCSGPSVEIRPRHDCGGTAIVADFGREINGGIEIELTGPCGTIIDIGYNEELINNRLPTHHDEYSFADRYMLRSGRQKIGNVFAERGFRMVQIVVRNPSDSVQLHSIRAVNRTYPYTPRGTFFSSDLLLNQIWSACTRTLDACTTDTFVDCPWRENAFWLNDLVVENTTSLQAFGDPRINARSLRLADSQMRPDGLIPAPVPFGAVPGQTEETSSDRLTLIAANLFRPQMIEEYLLYSGDTRLVRELMTGLDPLLATLACWEDADGLITAPPQFWNFIDWSFELCAGSLDGRNTATLNWFYVLMLDTLARLHKRLDNTRDTNSLTQRAARTAVATDKRFWNADHQCYLEWIDNAEPREPASQISHAVAVLTGRVPADHYQQVCKAISRDDLLAPELYLHHYVLRAMSHIGQGNDALSRIRKYWGSMVISNSPTIWEFGVHNHGKSALKGVGSNCHGFSTTPIDFLQSVILGVRPTEAGFSNCTFEPRTFDLEHAKGTIPTPLGDIQVAWKKNKARLAINIILPPGITAILKDGRRLTTGSHHVTFDS